MSPAEFEQFLSDCLDPTTEVGRAVLTPLRARTAVDLEIAQKAAILLQTHRVPKPLAVEGPAHLPPCF